MLRKLGCRVDVVGDGRQAIEANSGSPVLPRDYLSKPFKLAQILIMLERWSPKNNAASVSAATVATSLPTPEAEIPAVPLAAAPQRVAAEECLIDQRALDNIRALQIEGMPDMLGQIIQIYLSEAPNQLEGLAEAISGGDAPRIQEAAHSLKSSSANLGALQMADLCKTMENCGREGALAEVRQVSSSPWPKTRG